MTGHFFETVNYASVNEDWRTETRALGIRADDRILCVTGSGDRPLDLLPEDPGRIVAIDLNPAQNHLLSLKMAALKRLSYPDYRAFLGLDRAGEKSRAAVWKGLEDALPPASRDFWNRHPEMIRDGVIYRGRWERHFRRVARFGRLLRPGLIDRLFSFDDLEEQRTFLREKWDTPAWRTAWRAVCHPRVSRAVFGDPAFYAHVAVSPGRVLYDRMIRILGRYLARENFMISLVLRGVLPEGDLPPYLTRAGHDLMSHRLDRIETVTADVIEHLAERGSGRFDCFSLSDVPSFLSEDSFREFLAGVRRSAAPGARVCIRQFLTRYELPPGTSAWLRRDPALERELAADDRAFGYDFVVGMVEDA